MTRRERLLELLPEINLIQDSNIKDGVIKCHEYVFDKTEWDVDDYDKIPFIKSFKGCPVSCLHHTRIVARMCKMLADEYNSSYDGEGDYKLNHDIVVASAILHDIGKFLEWEKAEEAIKTPNGKLLRHPISGAIVAAQFGLPDEVVHAIFAHSSEGSNTRRTPEALLVWMVDELNFNCIRTEMGKI